MRRSAVLAVLAVFSAALGSGAALADVVNGGFETISGSFGGDGGLAVPVGNSTLITGWTVTGGGDGVAVIATPNIYGIVAPQGSQSLDISGYRANCKTVWFAWVGGLAMIASIGFCKPALGDGVECMVNWQLFDRARLCAVPALSNSAASMAAARQWDRDQMISRMS